MMNVHVTNIALQDIVTALKKLRATLTAGPDQVQTI